MATITVRDIRKSFGTIEVIHGTIAEGETLLPMTAGLESTNSGEFAIDDRAVDRVPPKERDVAVLCKPVQPRPGETICLMPDPADSHVFDPVTGRALRA